MPPAEARQPVVVPARERLRLYREIIQNATDAIGIIGLDGLYVEQNPAHRELTGYSDEELRWVTPAIHLGDEAYAAVHAQLVEKGWYRGEVVSRARDGTEREVELSAFVVRDERGQPLCYVGIKRDVTARKRADEEVREARAKLAMTDKLASLGSLVSGVAHEIRTPLTYIGTNLALIEAELARLDVPQEARGRLGRLLAEAQGGVTRVNGLVTDLRRFTRVPLDVAGPLDLAHALREVVEMSRATNRGRARLIVELEPALVAAGRRTRLQQVALNLLQNAFDATPPDGIVRVATRVVDGHAEMVIEDSGPGVPPAVAAHMWEPFFTTKPHGTGLGLAIVRRIVDEHGGAIRCEAREGGGTRFVVTLPQHAAA